MLHVKKLLWAQSHTVVLHNIVQGAHKIIGVYFSLWVFGVSIQCLHKPFDLINGFVIDDLHCLFLGVTKTLLSGLMQSTGLVISILDQW